MSEAIPSNGVVSFSIDNAANYLSQLIDMTIEAGDGKQFTLSNMNSASRLKADLNRLFAYWDGLERKAGKI